MKEDYETPESITDWAYEQFGPTFDETIAIRTVEEMTELLWAIHSGKHDNDVIDEVADVFILLYQILYSLGIYTNEQLHEIIDDKMRINRDREWNIDETGHATHVK